MQKLTYETFSWNMFNGLRLEEQLTKYVNQNGIEKSDIVSISYTDDGKKLTLFYFEVV